MRRCEKQLKAIKADAGVYWSDVSDILGISESKLYKVLRHEMSLQMENEIIKAIKEAERRKGDRA